MPNYHQKKIAMINDLSGYGRCSLTVALPILSAMGIQCCPVPTSILSNHTGFPVYYFDDYTDHMEPILRNGRSWGLPLTALPQDFWARSARLRL